MATPRKKRPQTSTPALTGEVSTEGTPPVYDERILGLIPLLEELVSWWQDRKITLEHSSDASRETERTTFHVERRWIEAIRRQADLDGLTITQVVNRAFQAFFADKST